MHYKTSPARGAGGVCSQLVNKKFVNYELRTKGVVLVRGKGIVDILENNIQQESGTRRSQRSLGRTKISGFNCRTES
jgi:hypothetical protein